MPGFCCVPGCTNRGRPYSFHKFPKEPSLLGKWIEAIRRDPGPYFTITEYTRVCSAHFTSDDYRDTLLGERARLKTNAVPSVFNWGVKDIRRGRGHRNSRTRKIERPVSGDEFNQIKSEDLTAINKISPYRQSKAVEKFSRFMIGNASSEKLLEEALRLKRVVHDTKVGKYSFTSENSSHDNILSENLHELLVPEVILEEKETEFNFKERIRCEKGTQAGSSLDFKDVECQTENLCTCQHVNG
ncbi:THAP domain-containing protein 1-like [Centruroides vittatus]|uniref:THAP domain-containing protein 1-like n=1 Tax=Centruroides vittatus TaxID=120091 RepID=UPI003510C5D2